ncbi:MAG: hypothetical protein OHK0046_47740 [Anaerolineae bacterium]
MRCPECGANAGTYHRNTCSLRACPNCHRLTHECECIAEVVTVCPECRGRGKFGGTPCYYCAGTGKVQ